MTKPARTLQDLRRILPSKQFARALREAEFLRLPLGGRVKPDHTRSELEARLLAVEVDGWKSHGTRAAFEDDHARDTRLKLLGYAVVRFTWRQVDTDAAGIARAIRAFLR